MGEIGLKTHKRNIQFWDMILLPRIFFGDVLNENMRYLVQFAILLSVLYCVQPSSRVHAYFSFQTLFRGSFFQ